MASSIANANNGKKLIVLGGGLSGLSFIHYLRNFSAALGKTGCLSNVTLVEANEYMGGSVKTRMFDDGVIHELGPRSVRVAGARAHNTVVLLEQLGLSDRILPVFKHSSAGKNRYIYNKGQLFKVPMSIGKVFSKLPASESRLGGAILQDLFKAEKMKLDDYPYKDPSLYDFFKHRFGEGVAESVLDPLFRGITAGDVRNLSTRALFSDLLDKEQTYGSVIKGLNKPPLSKTPHDELFPNDIIESKLLDKLENERWISYSLSTGLQTIPERLSDSLLNTNTDNLISIYNQTRVESVTFNMKDLSRSKCLVEVRTVDEDRVELEADHIVSTMPSKDFAKTIPPTTPTEQLKALENILQIPHAPVGCVCVEYRNLENLPEEMSSFGFLTHSKAGSKILGISFDSTMFPQHDREHGSTRMTCMIGGSWFKQVLNTDNVDLVEDSHLEEIALGEIRKILKIKVDPYRTSTLLWKTGIAQYTPGHTSRLQETREKIKKMELPLTLLGQSYDGVAVNDVIFSARQAAYQFVKSL